jgi:polyphosphate:AMP phosphotransferase
MFEAAEIGNKMSKEEYKKLLPKVREELIALQKELAGTPLAVVVLMGGVEGGGKSEMVNLLLEWLDARGVEVHALEERERPPYWRIWRELPAEGRIGFFVGSWYTAPIIDRAFKKIDDTQFDEALDRIVSFERMLTNEQTLVVKFWLHLSKKQQKKRFEDLESDKATRWRVTKSDWRFAERYDTFREISEQALSKTSSATAPWHIVEASDIEYRNITVARTFIDALRAGLAKAKEEKPKPTPDMPKPKPMNIIRRMDLAKKLDDKEYDEKLGELQGSLAVLSRQLYDNRRSMIVMLEGADAAGKGGAIRRLTQAMDARNYQVMPVAAPTEEERSHPYLWRFWRRLPRLGRVTIYDRSWYGRVLVERLEGFCRTEDWQRAFSEINEFEAELTDFGIILCKFWLQISAEEQLKRFKDREETPWKQFKIGPEDWRNRKKWDAYEAAACDVVEKTSTSAAPWTLVEANDKKYARIKVLKTVVERLERELK